MANLDIEHTLDRILNYKGVVNAIISTTEGQTLQNSKGLDDEVANKIAQRVSILSKMTRDAVKEFDPEDELAFLRIRSKNHEIIVSTDDKYLFIVTQNPS